MTIDHIRLLSQVAGSIKHDEDENMFNMLKIAVNNGVASAFGATKGGENENGKR